MFTRFSKLLPGLISAAMIAWSLLSDVPQDRKIELILKSIIVGIELSVVSNNGKKDEMEETQKAKEISGETEETQKAKEVSQDQ
jgi:hypothetical protein